MSKILTETQDDRGQAGGGSSDGGGGGGGDKFITLMEDSDLV
jgi:hypothetical protein